MEHFLSPEELGKILGLPKTKIWSLCRVRVDEGGLPHVRIGRHIRVRAADFERWLNETQLRQSAGV